jgi:hypothetical protein
MKKNPLKIVALAAALAASAAQADVVTDWNARVGEMIADAKMGTPPAHRLMAIVQTAVFDAVNAITKRYPQRAQPIDAAPGASVDAAVAAANRGVLLKLLPSQQAAIDAAYQRAIDKVADAAQRSAGIAVGERAAAAVLAARGTDGAGTPESWRPTTAPGVYVPTATPATPQWPQRTPWLLASAAQFRPAPPPALDSALWGRDFDEIKAVGAKASSKRSAEQTEVATFWEPTLPAIYHGVLRSAADSAGREPTRNARLFAAATQAMDDALIAVFDAKYAYGFWRPLTAIRNGDVDGHPATERDAGWTPFLDAPMHPEYPCAHCILSSTMGTVLKAELAGDAVPATGFATTGAKGVVRRWTNLDEFMREVQNARVWQGVHYRNSTEIGAEMGRKVGMVAAGRWFGADRMAAAQP